MKRLRIDDELAGRIDSARGDVPRDRWVARALEQALAGEPGGQSVSTAQGRSSEIRPGGAGSTPASPVARTGGPDAAPVTSPAPARASGLGKGSFSARPKK